MKIREVLATNLKRLRKERQWTQEDLAGEASVDRGYISKLENSKKEAGLDILPKLADALGVRPADLLTPIKNARESAKKK